MSSIVEEVAGIKREQEAQRGDLVRIENDIKELNKTLYGVTAALNQLQTRLEMISGDINNLPQPSNNGVSAEQVRAIVEQLGEP